jgi:hypothetical protein
MAALNGGECACALVCVSIVTFAKKFAWHTYVFRILKTYYDKMATDEAVFVNKVCGFCDSGILMQLSQFWALPIVPAFI